jgi:acetyl esterase/lipase
VSVGHLVPPLLFAASVLLAVAPIRRPRRLAVAGFVATLGVTELPQVFAVLLLVATVPAVVADGLPHRPAGWFLLGLTVLTCVGLVVLLFRAVQAGGVVGRAVVDGLGDAAGYTRPGLLRILRVLAVPVPVRPRQVERVRNLSYGDAGRRNLLDVYRHRSRPAGAPTLVYLHGGGYSSGHKHREARALLHRMAIEGWVCVIANYRLRPAAGFRDHLVDAKKVIAWVREHGPAYGADPRTVVVAGSSAGGQLAALAALTPTEAVLQPGFEQADTTVSAAVCLYGYYGRYCDAPDDEEAPSSPLDHDATGAPPFFLAHGDHDTYVPVAGAREFAAHLRTRSSSPVVYAELPGAQHAFDRFRSVRFDAVVEGVAAFLAVVHRRAGSTAGSRGGRGARADRRPSGARTAAVR